MGILRDGEGIPAGQYRVAVANAFDEEFVSEEKPPILHHLIDLKYASTKTSGIVCDVQAATEINITVEKPKPVKKK
jgi:hypothetical protein